MWDDGNDAWEDIEDTSDDPFYEKRVQANDAENKERLPTDMDIQNAKDRTTLRQEGAATMAHIQFKHWSRFWRHKLQKFFTQLVELSRRGDTQNWEKWHYDLHTNRVHEIEPPQMFFADPAVRALFRNMGSWMKETSETSIKMLSSVDSDNDRDNQSGWYTLPGPADWWPDQYDYKKFGFDVEAGNGEKYERAFQMMFELTPPELFKWILPGMDELMMVNHTRETEVLLQFFG